MNKKISLGVALALTLLAVALTATVSVMLSMRIFDAKVSSVKSRGAMYDKLDEMDTIVRNNYPGDIDDDILFDSVADGYIHGIADPYAVYLNADELAERAARDVGSITSIGVDTVKDGSTGYLMVTKVYKESAADVAGIVVGDAIIKINDEQVSGLTYEEGSSKLLGEEGESISVTYEHDTSEITRDLDFTTYELESVYWLRTDNVSYIRFTRDFNDTTVGQFRRALENVSVSKDKGLVIDLRNIGGGININYTADMLDMLLPLGPIIKGQYGENDIRVLFNSDPSCIELPITVLVNGGTSGYAELMAAVIRDYPGNFIVGEQTMGVGMHRLLYQMTDGTGILMSVCKLTTPKSVTFDVNGVMPDYQIELDYAVISSTTPDMMIDLQYKRALDIFDSMLRDSGIDPASITESEPESVPEEGAEETEEGAESEEEEESGS